MNYLINTNQKKALLVGVFHKAPPINITNIGTPLTTQEIKSTNLHAMRRTQELKTSNWKKKKDKTRKEVQ